MNGGRDGITQCSISSASSSSDISFNNFLSNELSLFQKLRNLIFSLINDPEVFKL